MTAVIPTVDHGREGTIQDLLSKDLASCAEPVHRFRVTHPPSVARLKAEIQSAMPPQWKLAKLDFVSRGAEESAEARGNTPEQAKVDARAKVPTDATVTEEHVQHNRPDQGSPVEAFTEDEARRKAPEEHEWQDITKVTMREKGSSGFLGLGRKPNTYSVYFKEQARVCIAYRTCATVEIMLIDTTRVQQCGRQGCEDLAVYGVDLGRNLGGGPAFQSVLCKAHAREFFEDSLKRPPTGDITLITDLHTRESWPASERGEGGAMVFMMRKLADWRRESLGV